MHANADVLARNSDTHTHTHTHTHAFTYIHQTGCSCMQTLMFWREIAITLHLFTLQLLVRLHVCMYVYIYTSRCHIEGMRCINHSLCSCMYVYTHTHMYIETTLHLCTLQLLVRLHVCMCSCMYVYTHI